MIFDRLVFRIAGFYGIAVLMPFYFMEKDPRAVPDPPLTHPEFYYGFLGVALAFQVVFFIIAADPVKYRLLMVPSALEKFSFAGALVALHVQGRFPQPMLTAGVIDLVLGCLFLYCFLRKPRE
jgi:hypothetical protein